MKKLFRVTVIVFVSALFVLGTIGAVVQARHRGPPPGRHPGPHPGPHRGPPPHRHPPHRRDHPPVHHPYIPPPDCFIATAVYGEDSNAVYVLRDYRDSRLVKSKIGREIIDFYYKNGPSAAEFVQNHRYTKPILEVMLLPVVGSAYLLIII